MAAPPFGAGAYCNSLYRLQFKVFPGLAIFLEFEMPIYAYRCDDCGFEKDVLQKFADSPLTDCPECKRPAFNRMVSAPAFQLKGTGWYVTDFRGGKPGGGEAGESKSGGEAAAATSGAADGGSAAGKPAAGAAATGADAPKAP